MADWTVALIAAAGAAKAKLVGKRQPETEFHLIEVVRLVVIDHELADQLFINDKRNKGQGADAFRLDDGSKCLIQICCANVIQADRLRIFHIRTPG